MKEILNELVIISTNITLWSGRKRLSENDLKLVAGSELPPADLASLGSKRVMDPAALSPFERLKRKAEREILSVGVRFLNGYAVPKKKMKELMATLGSIETEFETAKREFVAEYDQTVESWIAANPGWEEAIQRSVENVAYVERQLSFSVQTYSISAPRSHRSGLEKEVSGLAGQLRQEIGQMARSAWEASFQGKTEVGQRAVRPLRAMLSKVEGLVFLEQGLHELVEGIRAILDALPSSGSITGGDFASVCGCLYLLGDIPEAREVGESPPQEQESAQEQEEMIIDPPRPITPVQWF